MLQGRSSTECYSGQLIKNLICSDISIPFDTRAELWHTNYLLSKLSCPKMTKAEALALAARHVAAGKKIIFCFKRPLPIGHVIRA